MKVTFFIFFHFILLSCNDSTQATQETGKIDSLPAINTRKVDPIDERKAFGSLMFGMTRKDASNLKMEHVDSIGNYEYMFNPIYTSTDSLFLLEIKGYSETANYFDTKVRSEYENLVAVITKKYGEPDENGYFPYFMSMKSGYLEFATKWNLGDKCIWIGAGEDDSRYYACCWIFNKDMKERVWKARESEENEKVNNDVQNF